LIDRNELVLAAVEEKKRRGVTGDVRYWRSPPVLIGMIRKRAAQKRLDDSVFQIARPVARREIGQSEEAHHGLHAAGLVGVAAGALESIVLSSHAKHRSEVSTSGETNNTNTLWVNPVFRGIGPQPAYRGLAILELRGEAGCRHEPVRYSDAHVAQTRNAFDEVIHLLAIPLAPAPAVQKHDDGKRTVSGFWHRQVEQQRRPLGRSVNDVAFDRKCSRVTRRRDEQQECDQREYCGAPEGDAFQSRVTARELISLFGGGLPTAKAASRGSGKRRSSAR